MNIGKNSYIYTQKIELEPKNKEKIDLNSPNYGRPDKNSPNYRFL